MSTTINLETAGALMRAAVDIADGSADLATRRTALLELLARITNSDSGNWTWLRARPESERIMAVGFIPYHFSRTQQDAFIQLATDPRLQKDTHSRLQDHMQKHPRDDGVWSVLFADVIPELASSEYWLTKAMHHIDIGPWAQCGRYLPGNAVTVINLGRRPGRAPYEDADRQVMDLAMTHIPWLWASPDERVPQKDVEALSPRQRAVAFMLLDGLSRKRIASRLGISEETVNHHTKAVFRHFGVQSATELAALFLRSQ